LGHGPLKTAVVLKQARELPVLIFGEPEKSSVIGKHHLLHTFETQISSRVWRWRLYFFENLSAPARNRLHNLIAHDVSREMKNSIPYHPLSKDLLNAVFKLDPDLVKESIEARFAQQTAAMLLRELDEQIRKGVAMASLAIASGAEISEVLSRLQNELRRYFDIRKLILSHTAGEKTEH